MSDFDSIPWQDARLADLRRFATVVQAGGFTAAARQLGESAKQLSRRIALLEDSLGVALFQRTTRSVHATPDGLRLYEAVQVALGALDEGLESVSKAGVSGLVRVQIPSLFADGFVQWLSTALWAFPDLRVELTIADIAPALGPSGLDIVVTAEPGASTTVIRRTLGTVSAHLVASHGYVERNGSPANVSELVHHECLRFVGTETHNVWPLSYQGGPPEPVAVGGRLSCGDSRALLQALHLGLGIGPMAPGYAARDVVRVLPDWRFAPMDMYVLVAPERRRLARVRTVLEGIQQVMAQDASLAR